MIETNVTMSINDHGQYGQRTSGILEIHLSIWRQLFSQINFKMCIFYFEHI